MVLLIDKPLGVTSFDVIRQLRRELGVRKMGHAGTLDPLASGLLIVATEEDTKKLNEFLKLPKVYEVGIRIGEQRSTGDLEGEVLEKVEVSDLSEEEVRKVVDEFVGVYTLSVPIYSAIKVDGKPLYWYARNNKKVEVPQKDMEVLSTTFLRIEEDEEYQTVFLELEVSSGTYIRSLAELFGTLLGYPATVSFLRRTRVGKFSVEDAKKMEP